MIPFAELSTSEFKHLANDKTVLGALERGCPCQGFDLTDLFLHRKKHCYFRSREKALCESVNVINNLKVKK